MYHKEHTYRRDYQYPMSQLSKSGNYTSSLTYHTSHGAKHAYSQRQSTHNTDEYMDYDQMSSKSTLPT